MSQKITDTIVKRLPTPAAGNRIEYADEVKGFGGRVPAAGSRAFILNYRTRVGRERRYTIGAFPEWKASDARVEAKELKKRIDRGEDPMAEVEAGRDAKTVADLAERFIEQHLPRTRPTTAVEYKATINKDILPALGRLKVAAPAASQDRMDAGPYSTVTAVTRGLLPPLAEPKASRY